MKKGVKTAIVICLTAVLVIGLVWIVRYYAGLKHDEDTMAEVQETAKPVETEPAAETGTSVAAIADLASVQEKNSDVVAWIKWTGEGSVIDYPVCQSTPDEGEDYYLDHDIEKADSISGAIYMQQVDAPDFSDYITVLYGHNMRNGSMFKGLHNFYDKTYFDNEENRTFLVQTADKLLTYKVYAAVRFGNDLIPGKYNDTVPEARSQFLSDIAACRDMTSHIDTSMNVTEEDKLLVMSTCVANTHDYRYVVVAVLQDEEPLS